MNPIQSIFKIHKRDKWGWFFIPSIILFSSFSFNYIIALLINSGESFYNGAISSIFIYMLIMGVLVLVQTFPFALGMSLRRTDYFIGTSIVAGIASLVIAILLLLLSFVEKSTGGWGIKFHFFHLPYINDGNVFEQFGIYVILLVYLFFLGFIFSSVFRRFGRSGMFTLAIGSILIIGVLVLLANHFNWWIDIFQWVIAHSAFELAMWLLPFTVLHILISYLFLRKATF